ncbi:O-acetyl-ADP-ribose deacetylase [hydrothermal vent metagenome]|uniref:O-acetyl-ADP-ribose deacetylase n=1 Tax=hydrothermal vent metagenome TaxID=652676 RepID=A0A3B0Y8G5_9ZZZZ
MLETDITQLEVDAIVNAANNAMCGGGGVDGAIHRAAGDGLLSECRSMKGCKTGYAKITKGYELPAKYVIHTVGPVWYGGHKNEEELLASCYRECMRIANENDFKSLAFPAISCGAYRFPIERASEIAITEIMRTNSNNTIQHVIFSCFNSKIKKALQKVISKHQHQG